MTAPSEKISKSTICDFRYWLIITVAVLITLCEIFSRRELENHHFRRLYVWTPSVVKPNNINVIAEKYIQWVTTLSLTIRVCLHSFSSCCLSSLRDHAKFRENSNL